MSSSNINQQQYLYVPTEWICIIFVSLFAVSTVVHIVQAIRSRLWWLFPSAVFSGFLEITGWSARLWSSHNAFSETSNVIQAVNLVVAPTPLVAVNFIVLGLIILRLGPQYSRLTPRRYAIIFISFDITALVVQGTGGVIAGRSQMSASQTSLGGHIVLGGTIFQLVSIIMYCSLAVEFLARYTRDRPVPRSTPLSDVVPRGTPDKRLNCMLLAMLTMTVFILTRTTYRVVEFVSGWSGKVVSTQWLFNVFDGTMIALAMLTLNVFHPGIYLRREGYPPATSSEGATVQEDRFKRTPNMEKAV